MATLQQIILEKKAALAASISEPLARLAECCADCWDQPDRLDGLLHQELPRIGNCAVLYAWDLKGRQCSSLVTCDKIDTNWRGNDLSNRPYLKNNLPLRGVMLSSVYESMLTHGQCVSALQAVHRGEVQLGFIAADFTIDALLADARLVAPDLHYQQYRGDPAVRGTLFMQQRIQSRMDEHIDAALETIFRLITEHGVFHVKIHFSSGRVSLWPYDDPYSYRIHVVDEVIDPDLPLYYPMHEYPERARITPKQVRQALEMFRQLRFADETIYLRSASVNIVNGMLGLTFSCDGSHYLQAEEFLEKNIGYWIGQS